MVRGPLLRRAFPYGSLPVRTRCLTLLAVVLVAATGARGADRVETKRAPARAGRSPARPGRQPRSTIAVPAPALSAVVPNPVVTPWIGSCRVGSMRPFESLESGVFDYCRGHLRYEPGALDCYHFIDEVCELLDPTTGEWFDTHSPEGREVFVCPDAPEPPVCPRLGP